jgi:hypothetical protein
MAIITLLHDVPLAFHGDLHFKLEALHLIADTYYFELDRNPASSLCEMAAVRNSLSKLIHQWLARIEALTEGDTTSLPFDYSDQYTGVLLIQLEGNQLVVWSGWSDLEGWAHYPSDISEFSERAGTIHENATPRVRMDRLDFIEQLKRDLKEFATTVPIGTEVLPNKKRDGGDV